MSHLKNVPGTRATPQRDRARDDQVENSEGGYVFPLGPWAQLRRFLILGSEGGSFYASERKLTLDNIAVLKHCTAEDPRQVVDLLVEISTGGLAPKNDYALYALAYVAGTADTDGRKYALDALPAVARTGTHLFQFVEYVTKHRGWGRQLKRAITHWYLNLDADRLALQLVKYRQRGGWTHQDILRHVKPGRRVSSGNLRSNVDEDHARLFKWVTGGDTSDETAQLPRLIQGYQQIQSPKLAAMDAAQIIGDYRLPREAVPTELLTKPGVWEALLDGMPMTALIRNLATMTRVGLLTAQSDATKRVLAQLADGDWIRKARVHPIQVLSAMLTYSSGHGMRGQHSWQPVAKIVDALDAAFYLSFGNVEPTGERIMLALDVSSSMGSGTVAGVPGLSPRVASSAMALVTAAVETDHEFVAFQHELVPVAISPRQRIDDVCAIRWEGGGTDCALPMIYATENRLDIDAFVIYTDSETHSGLVHPFQALKEYRQLRVPDAKLIVVGMVSNGFTIADPSDPGMLDVVGFDTSTPQVMSEFIAGRL